MGPAHCFTSLKRAAQGDRGGWKSVPCRTQVSFSLNRTLWRRKAEYFTSLVTGSQDWEKRQVWFICTYYICRENSGIFPQ